MNHVIEIVIREINRVKENKKDKDTDKINSLKEKTTGEIKTNKFMEFPQSERGNDTIVYPIWQPRFGESFVR
jgi:hypothetical protein